MFFLHKSTLLAAVCWLLKKLQGITHKIVFMPCRQSIRVKAVKQGWKISLCEHLALAFVFYVNISFEFQNEKFLIWQMKLGNFSNQIDTVLIR